MNTTDKAIIAMMAWTLICYFCGLYAGYCIWGKKDRIKQKAG